MQKTLPTLEEVLAYRHPQVVRSYQRQHPQNAAKAEELFTDMLKYLWLSCKHTSDAKSQPEEDALNFLLVMHEEMRDIDNMWHAFLLYTKDYTDFCVRYFGEYLHHQPDVAETNPQPEKEFTSDFEKFLSYTYDHLGEATVRSWFAQHIEATV